MFYQYKPNNILCKTMLENFSGEWLSEWEHEQYTKHYDQIDEYYHQTPVDYRYNSRGYRTKEFEELNGDFLLAMGCSHTEGTALPQKDIWCTVLADMLDLDLINMGSAGQGLEFICYNTELYLKNNYPLPKVVVLQHPERARMVHTEMFEHCPHEEKIIELHVKVNKQSTRHTEESDIENHVYTTVFRSAMLTNLITRMWNSVGVPVYHWTFNTDGEDWLSDYHVFEIPTDIDRDIYHYELDHARDLSHHGYRNHRCVATVLKDKVSELLESRKLHIPSNPFRHRNLLGDSMENQITKNMNKLISQENTMSEEHNEEDTHEGSMGTDRHPPSGTEQDQREAELKRRIEELRKRDPFIYR